MPIFKQEGSAGEEAFFNNYNGNGVGAVCYEGELVHERPLTGQFDAGLEENLHTISAIGYANAYPEAFAEGPNSNSRLTLAMDKARGGHFLSIPNPYPDGAWYHYDDETCNYNCMATEYFYWGLTSMLGIQDYGNRCQEIGNEWQACTASQFQTMDTTLYNLFSDAQYIIPTQAPDGNYCPTTSSQNNLNDIGDIFKVFPNPAQNEIKCMSKETEMNNYKIYSFNGQLVYESENNQKNQSINLRAFSNGVYFIVLNNVYFQKLVVSK